MDNHSSPVKQPTQEDPLINAPVAVTSKDDPLSDVQVATTTTDVTNNKTAAGTNTAAKIVAPAVQTSEQKRPTTHNDETKKVTAEKQMADETKKNNKNSAKRSQQKSFLKKIPRTVRWRIQLGLLNLPSSVTSAVAAANLTQSINRANDNTNPSATLDGTKDQKVSDGAEEVETVLKTPTETNSNPPDPLSQVQVTSKNVTVSPSPEKKNPTETTTTPKIALSSSTQFTLSDILNHNLENIQTQQERYDSLAQKHLWENSPLALIEKEEEEEEAKKQKKEEESTKKDEDDTKLEKQSSSTNVLKVQCNVGSDPLSAMLMEEKDQDETPKQQEQHQEQEGDEEPEESSPKKGNSSWSEFYSSRETLNLIEKDLNRLSPSHYLVAPISILYSTDPSKDKESTNDDTAKVGLDDNNDTAKPTSIQANPSKSDSVEERKNRRVQLLAQILFIYARHNPSLGYRQGMHEILSFILIAFEVDFHNAYSTKELKKGNDEKTDESDMQQNCFQKDKIAHEIFAIFETIMYYLSPAYDSSLDTIEPPPHLVEVHKHHASYTMEHIGEKVLQQVRINGSDPLYYHLIEDVHIPPQLYCARWVRLMFTREISSVHQSLFLWDKIFYTMHRKHVSLLPILEYTCAAMILRVQDKFHIHYGDNDGHDDDYDDDPNDSINALMNYPPIDDVKSLWKTISDILEGRLIKTHVGSAGSRDMKSPQSKASERHQNPIGMANAMNKVQNLTRPFLMGAGRAMSASNPSQMYTEQEEKPPQAFNGMFRRMNNIYNGKMGREEKQQQRQVIHAEEHKNNKHVFGERYHAEQIQQQYYDQRQKDPVHNALSRVSNTWSKAVDTFGESIEHLVVRASTRGTNNIPYSGRNPDELHSFNAVPNSLNYRNEANIQDSYMIGSELGNFSNSSLDRRMSQSVIVLSNYLESIKNIEGINVPSAVWEAVKDLDSVRKEIITKQASMEPKDDKNLNHPLVESQEQK